MSRDRCPQCGRSYVPPRVQCNQSGHGAIAEARARTVARYPLITAPDMDAAVIEDPENDVCYTYTPRRLHFPEPFAIQPDDTGDDPLGAFRGLFNAAVLLLGIGVFGWLGWQLVAAIR